jgi:hypothetical protein
MRNIESIPAAELLANAVTFAKLGPKNGVSNFIIEGPIDTADRNIKVMAGIFPYGSDLIVPGYAIIGTEPQPSMVTWNRRILNLQLPQRVRQSGVPDIPLLCELFSKRSAINGWPEILIAFGKYTGSENEFVQLFHIAGMSPQTALRSMRDRARDRLAKLQ